MKITPANFKWLTRETGNPKQETTLEKQLYGRRGKRPVNFVHELSMNSVHQDPPPPVDKVRTLSAWKSDRISSNNQPPLETGHGKPETGNHLGETVI